MAAATTPLTLEEFHRLYDDSLKIDEDTVISLPELFAEVDKMVSI